MRSPRPEGSQQASLRMIAEEAGVSLMTVSRALRGSTGVSPATRHRVLELARKRHYTPNLLVTGLRTGRSWTAGLMMPVAHRFCAEIIAGAYAELAAANYAMMLADLPVDYSRSGDGADVRQLMPLIERRVDGLIFRPTDDQATDNQFSELRRRRIPFVTVDRHLPAAHCDFIGTDDYGGGVMAARHLLELGHRRVGHLAGPDVVSTARERRRGFEDTVRAAGGTCVTIGMPDFVDRDAAEHFLALKPRPTAVFCANDPMALLLNRIARERDVRMPGDLSVIGFADLPEAALATPGLTTIHQDPRAIGKRAAQVLISRISRGTPAGPYELIRLAPSLVLRQSTAPIDLK